METTRIYKSLHNNGIITERARREGRSLTRLERFTIAATREMATRMGIVRHSINMNEMKGERDKDSVLKPTKVVAVFAYYDDSGINYDIPPFPVFVIRESNHIALTVGSHVSGSQFKDIGLKTPKAPSYKKWNKNGRKIIRK